MRPMTFVERVCAYWALPEERRSQFQGPQIEAYHLRLGMVAEPITVEDRRAMWQEAFADVLLSLPAFAR